jgi:hypothetical protein
MDSSDRMVERRKIAGSKHLEFEVSLVDRIGEFPARSATAKPHGFVPSVTVKGPFIASNDSSEHRL